MTKLTLSDDQTRLLRLRAQGLLSAGAPLPSSPAPILKQMLGAQAQDLTAALLSVRARSTGLTANRIEEARQEERSIVWTWCMRGTLHLISADDSRWLIPLLGPRMIAARQRRFRQLGWDEEHFATALRLLQEELSTSRGLTRSEIARLLEANGLPFEGQAPYYLMYGAALKGILCYGPDRDQEQTCVPLEEWIGKGKHHSFSRQEALTELALRYLDAYGPARPEDLARWSGLKLGDVRETWKLITEQTVDVEINGGTARLLKTHLSLLDEVVDALPTVRLLPRFDTYLLGYANRDLIVDPAYARRVHPGGGIIHPVLLVNGKAVGTWKAKRRSSYQEILVEPFAELADGILAYVEVEVADLARFTGEEAVLTID